MKIELNDIVCYRDVLKDADKYGMVVEILEVQKSVKSDYEGALVYKVVPVGSSLNECHGQELRDGVLKVYKQVK